MPPRKKDKIGDEVEAKYGWRLPIIMQNIKKDLKMEKFSFTGIRSSVDRLAEKWIDTEERRTIAREAMRRCWEHLASRVTSVLKNLRFENPPVNTVVVSGGVASNMFLRDVLQKQLNYQNFKDIELLYPPIEFCTDNAAMIAWTGWEMYQAGFESTLDISPFRRWSLQPLDDKTEVVERDWIQEAYGILEVPGWKKREAVPAQNESSIASSS